MQTHELWPVFSEWCQDNGINLAPYNSDSWLLYWNCFLSGAVAQVEILRLKEQRTESSTRSTVT